MGTKYVEVPGLEFDKLYEDSGPSTPVFFILSPGVDPLKDVEKLGTGYILCYTYISYHLVEIHFLNTFFLCRIEAGIFH